ncbi:hypothetical protein HMPREF1582_00876, partial [Gardnerella vaginalis JCP8151A]
VMQFQAQSKRLSRYAQSARAGRVVRACKNAAQDLFKRGITLIAV